MGRAATVLLPAFLGALAMLAAGCPSGPFGARPEIRGLTEGGEGRDTVTVSFDLRDEDLSAASVRVEYTTGGDWSPATLATTTLGEFSAGVVTGLRPGTEWAACDLGWDTLADAVGAAGPVTVMLRLTPLDADGEGEPKEITIAVDNFLAEVALDEDEVIFGNVLAGAQNPADESLHISNSGSVGTTLNWTVSVEYQGTASDWLTVSPNQGSATTETDAVTLSADPLGSSLGVGTYTATVTVAV